MSEGPDNRNPITGLDRAVAMAALALVLVTWLHLVPTNIWLSAVMFLLSSAGAAAAIGTALGSWRIGALVGVAAGALYLVFLFSRELNGGYAPGLSGWPITFTRE